MRATAASALLLVAAWTSSGLAVEKPDDDIPLAATLSTEGTLPATEIEAGFGLARSSREHRYHFGLSSLQYAWGTTFGVKLVVPVFVVEPRGEPAHAGPSDLLVLLRYVPIVSVPELFALATGVTVTLPTGSESRGLGGTFAIAPGLYAGKAWRPGGTVVSLQTEIAYSWQINEPARVAPDDPDGTPTFPDREQRLIASVSAAVAPAPVPWLTGIVEINTVTLTAGDSKLRDRVQLYVTPGLSVTPGSGWNIRAGVQVAVTRARAQDQSVILLVTKGF